MKESVTGANTEPLTKIHPILLGKQRVGGAGLLARHRQQLTDQDEDGNSCRNNSGDGSVTTAGGAPIVDPLAARTQMYNIQQQNLLHTQRTLQQLARSSYTNFVSAREKDDEVVHRKPDENNNTPVKVENGANEPIIPQKKALVPGLTLYVPDPCWESELENDSTMVELGGFQMLIIVESCRRSKIEFMFKTLFNGSSYVHQLVVANRVIAACCGAEVAQVDVAKKALETLHGRQPMIYKPIEEKPLGQGDMIPGLILFFDKSVELEPGEHYEVINRSCEKSKLLVEWWDTGNNLENIKDSNKSNSSEDSGIQQIIILLIKRRVVSVGMGSSYVIALSNCAEKAVSRLLESNHLFLFESEMTPKLMAEFETTMSNLNGHNQNGAMCTVTEESKIENNTIATTVSEQSNAVLRGGTISNGVGKLGENNVGHRLLCKMGWKGTGGIGRHENGISDPIEPTSQAGKCTLGIGYEAPEPCPKRRKKGVGNAVQSHAVRLPRASCHDNNVIPSLPPLPRLPQVTAGELVPGLVLRLPSKDTILNKHQMKTKTKKKYIEQSCRAMNYCVKLVRSKKDASNILGRLISIDLLINDQLVCSAVDKQPQEAALIVYEKCFDILLQRQPIVYKIDGTSASISTPSGSIDNKSNFAHFTGSPSDLTEELISGFVLSLPTKAGSRCFNVLNLHERIICESCVQCNKHLQVDETYEHARKKAVFRCTILIDEIAVASITGRTFEAARRSAFQNAYSKLKANPRIRKIYSSKLADVITEERHPNVPLTTSPVKSEGLFKRTVTVIRPNATLTTSMSTPKAPTTTTTTARSAVTTLISSTTLTTSTSARQAPTTATTSARSAVTTTKSAAKTTAALPTASSAQKQYLIPGLVLYLPYPGCMAEDQDASKIIRESCDRIKCPFGVVPSDRPSVRGLFCSDLYIQGKLITAGYGEREDIDVKEAFPNGVYVLMNRQPVVYDKNDNSNCTDINDYGGVNSNREPCAAGDSSVPPTNESSPLILKEEGVDVQDKSMLTTIELTDSSPSPSSISLSSSDSDSRLSHSRFKIN